jgi:AcrR family transcriptional regulator
MSNPKKARIVKVFEDGATFDQAAAAVGVSSRTIYRWCDGDPEFAEMVEEARDRADDAVESTVFRNCLDPDSAHNTLRMFWLKSRRRHVYGDQSKLELTGKNGGPVEVLSMIDKVYGNSNDDGTPERG